MSFYAKVCLLVLLAVVSTVLAKDPDVGRNITELITSKGFPCEQHFVTTDDGFVLSIQRIPYSSRSPRAPGKKPVFLQHGLEDSAHTWANNFADQSLAFILADAGYDVWLGNSRGNMYSKTNIHYTTKQSEFWQWSWQEMAQYDLPAVIAYIVRKTEQPKIAYVGHSQGTTQAFVAFSSNQDVASKVSVFVALAPVAYLASPGSVLFSAMAKLHVDTIVKLLGIKEFLPSTKVLEVLLPEICHRDPSLCTNVYCLSIGCNFASVNQTRMPVYFSKLPAGTSTQDMIHWAQLVRTKKFQAYDFGANGNKKHYGQSTPPEYDLGKLMVPVGVFHGGKDTLADPKDVQTMLGLIPKDKLAFHQYVPEYGHCDFVWGTDANSLIYKNVLSLIKDSFK